MPQTTFGRRGLASPAPAQLAYRPAPVMSAPEPTAAPQERSLAGYFLWLLFQFDGRLDRRTYRYCRIAANLSFVLLITTLRSTEPASADPRKLLAHALLLLGGLALMAWTTLAMQVKRRHDRDKSWPWLFVGFIPIAGSIWVLIETCWLDGTPGFNRFDDPKKTIAAQFA